MTAGTRPAGVSPPRRNAPQGHPYGGQPSEADPHPEPAGDTRDALADDSDPLAQAARG
ncbi:hypothetical protein GTW59_38795 [Streptomyces sp. SID89]|nr:hypothetical protein [Streptomyces sp. SID89]